MGTLVSILQDIYQIFKIYILHKTKKNKVKRFSYVPLDLFGNYEKIGKIIYIFNIQGLLSQKNTRGFFMSTDSYDNKLTYREEGYDFCILLFKYVIGFKRVQSNR